MQFPEITGKSGMYTTIYEFLYKIYVKYIGFTYVKQICFTGIILVFALEIIDFVLGICYTLCEK